MTRMQTRQYTSVRFTETLALEGLSASIGSVGDTYDNAAAETVFGLFKNEAVASGSPFRTGPLRHLADFETLTMHYVHWSTASGPTSTSTTSPPRPPSNLTTICEPWQQPGDSRKPRSRTRRKVSLRRLAGAGSHRAS